MVTEMKFYSSEEGRILGNEEFVDAMIHRIGQTRRRTNGSNSSLKREFDAEALAKAVEKSCGIAQGKICGPGKSAELMRAKEAMILVGRNLGASVKELSELVSISISGVSRRHDAARRKAPEDQQLSLVTDQIEKDYYRFANRK